MKIRKIDIRPFYISLTCIFTVFLSLQIQACVLWKIKTDKFEYLRGEPIVLYVSLQNTGNIPVALPTSFDPEHYAVGYKINGKGFRPQLQLDGTTAYKYFAPGEILREEVSLFFNDGKWLFAKPGIYTITAGSHGWVSNTLTISVKSSDQDGKDITVPVEQAAQLILESYHAGLSLFWRGENIWNLTEGIQVLQQVITDYPNTPQATFAAQTLGNSQLFQGNYQKALPFLKMAKQQPVGLYDVLHTHISLYKTYMGLENTQAAKTVLGELKTIILKRFNGFELFVDAVLNKNDVSVMFHRWEIQEIYSNEDGSIQFIELSSSSDHQSFPNGVSLTSADSSGKNIAYYAFRSNVGIPISKRNLLLATPGFAALPGSVTPDYEIPFNFLSISGGILNFSSGLDVLNYEELPTDGVASLVRNGNTNSSRANSPTNFVGKTGYLTQNNYAILDGISGTLQIPMVNVPGANGDVSVFSVILQRLPNSSDKFQLISIKPTEHTKNDNNPFYNTTTNTVILPVIIVGTERWYAKLAYIPSTNPMQFRLIFQSLLTS